MDINRVEAAADYAKDWSGDMQTRGVEIQGMIDSVRAILNTIEEKNNLQIFDAGRVKEQAEIIKKECEPVEDPR